MASPFPQRTGGMTGGNQGEVLDGPPPSPAMPMAGGGGMGGGAGMSMGGGGMAAQPFPSFDQMSQPLTAGTPGRAITPEIAMGVMQTAETIFGILDSMASIAPDLANDFALQKDLLQRTMGKLLVASGQPASSNATGLNFPGGGFASGR